MDARPSQAHLCWQVAALSSPVDSEASKLKQPITLPSEALGPLHLKIARKRLMALAQSLPHSPAWARLLVLGAQHHAMEHTADPHCGGQHIPLCPALPLTKESFSRRPQGLNAKDKACISSSPASSGPHMHLPVILHRNVPAVVQRDCPEGVTSLREEG